MKKSMLYTGIGYVLFGAACLLLAAVFEWKIEGLLWGLAGAGICPGLVMLWKYFHWTKPENQAEYAQRLKTEQIEIHDERNAMLRDKSGRLTMQFSFVCYCLLMLLFAACMVMEWLMPFARHAILLLGALLALQYICWNIFFRCLSKKL